MDQQMLISVLTYGLLTVSGAFFFIVAYIAKRIDSQLRELTVQGGELKELVKDEINRLDRRIGKLEDWREGVLAGGHMGKL